jgi:hypothetical protein
MSWKTIAALLVLALGLGGYFYYDTYWLGPARDKAESVKGRLWAVEPKDVDAVSIKRSGETVRLKRGDAGAWQVLEPVKARGDRGAIDEVVTSLATARVDREVAANPGALAEFGLDPPAAEVRLEVKGRSEPLVLLVGAKSPTGAWVYGKEPSKSAVVTLGEGISRDVARPVGDFRDKTIIAFDRKSVTGIDLDVDGNRFSAVADEPGKWRIVKPAEYRADGDMVADFLDKLESGKVKEFVADGGAPPAQSGLDRPSRVTLWTGKDKDRSSKTLLFGAADPGKSAVYVMREGDPGVLLVPDDVWKAVPKTVAALRDKVVIAYAYDKANRVQVDSARGTVTLEKDGSAWKITAPEALRADSGAVSNLLWKIRDLRASGFLGETPADVSRYLAKPDVTVRIWEEGSKEPHTLLVKSSAERRGAAPAAVAAVAGHGPVMLVDGKAVEDLSRTAADLRDRSVFPAFDLTDVKRARIAAAGKTLAVERSGDSDWKVVEPSRGAAKEAKVSNALMTVKSLRWKDIVSPKGDAAARYGLDRPELELTLFKDGATELGTLLVGKQEGDLTYVRLKSSPVIYSVDSKLVDDLRKAPTDIPG